MHLDQQDGEQRSKVFRHDREGVAQRAAAQSPRTHQVCHRAHAEEDQRVEEGCRRGAADGRSEFRLNEVKLKIKKLK